MSEADLDLLAILQALAHHKVEYVIVGGVSAILHGAPISTVDLDIVHSRSEANVERLRSALSSLQAFYREHPDRRLEPEAKPLRGTGHHLLMTKAGPLDVLCELTGQLHYEDLLSESEALEVSPDVRVRVLSLPALIRLKEAMGREKDRAVLAILRRTLEERSRG